MFKLKQSKLEEKNIFFEEITQQSLQPQPSRFSEAQTMVIAIKRKSILSNFEDLSSTNRDKEMKKRNNTKEDFRSVRHKNINHCNQGQDQQINKQISAKAYQFNIHPEQAKIKMQKITPQEKHHLTFSQNYQLHSDQNTFEDLSSHKKSVNFADINIKDVDTKTIEEERRKRKDLELDVLKKYINSKLLEQKQKNCIKILLLKIRNAQTIAEICSEIEKTIKQRQTTNKEKQNSCKCIELCLCPKQSRQYAQKMVLDCFCCNSWKHILGYSLATGGLYIVTFLTCFSPIFCCHLLNFNACKLQNSQDKIIILLKQIVLSIKVEGK